MTYKTPGVYIQEVSLFPPSVAQVETAIPAFVGYTEKASDANEKSLAGTPVRIRSLVEFQSLFGSAHLPAAYKVVADADKALVSATPDKRFYLFDALRQFYDNGGGHCYIVSVGSFGDAIGFDALKKGAELLRKVDEPTLLLVPDAVGLLDASDDPDLAKFTDLQKVLLTQCAELQDRFAILDILEGHLPEDTTNTPIKDFRDTIGVNNLSYGAAYYPWIITSYSSPVSFRQLQLFTEADLDNAVTDYDPYGRDDAEKALVAAAVAGIEDSDAVLDLSDPQLEKTALRQTGAAHLQGILAEYQAGIDANTAIVTNITDYLNLLCEIAVAFPRAEDQAQADSEFSKEIALIQGDSELIDALKNLVAIEKNPKTIDNTAAPRDAAQVALLYAPLETAWLGGSTVAAIAADTTDFAKTRTGCLDIIIKLAVSVKKILGSYQRLLEAALHFERTAGEAVFANHLFFRGAYELIVKRMRTLPPSGTVAGVYAAVDNARGVWKAPANVSVNAVIGPAVRLDNKDQEELNVHTTGKSINAIRAFTGKGTLVWGARTLAGNDNEWRYVPVRRFYIMVEESVKKATEPFVFEPNDANTWVKVRAMIENFLILQWRAGALQGAKPEEAFFVNVGLNETMTAQDILEGRMIVEIGMAAVRPAEFIILRFSHKMQSANG